MHACIVCSCFHYGNWPRRKSDHHVGNLNFNPESWSVTCDSRPESWNPVCMHGLFINEHFLYIPIEWCHAYYGGWMTGKFPKVLSILTVTVVLIELRAYKYITHCSLCQVHVWSYQTLDDSKMACKQCCKNKKAACVEFIVRILVLVSESDSAPVG